MERDSSSSNASGSGGATPPAGRKKLVLPFAKGNRRDTDDVSRASETPRSLPRTSPDGERPLRVKFKGSGGEDGLVGEPGDSKHSKRSDAVDSNKDGSGKSEPVAIPQSKDPGAMGDKTTKRAGSDNDSDWDFPSDEPKAGATADEAQNLEENQKSFGKASVGSWTFPSYMQRPGGQREPESNRSSYEATSSLGLNSRSISIMRSPFADADDPIDAVRPPSEQDMFASFNPRANFVTEADLRAQQEQQQLPQHLPPASRRTPVQPRSLAPIISMSGQEVQSQESSEDIAPANDPRPRAQLPRHASSTSLHSEPSEHVFAVDD